MALAAWPGMSTIRLALLALLSFSIAACAGDPAPDPDDPGPLGKLVAGALDEIGHVPADPGGLEYNIFELDDAELEGDVTAESCDAVDNALAPICSDLVSAGDADYCSYDTAFFYAHQVPRCAVRFHSYRQDSAVNPMHLFDFSGTPLSGPAPLCGNGELDDGEECDDGNHELWDGCDSGCSVEPFTGCEAVIEEMYAQAGLATVDRDDWDGPRSHLMVNRQAVALTEVSEASCQAAIATATDVCRELEQQMPFVGWCSPSGLYHPEESGPECSIRLQVWFQAVDPDAGVYTTSLPGLLAFTIR
jgi:cysteine-rich repeat protein